MANKPIPPYKSHEEFFLRVPLYDSRTMTAPQIKEFFTGTVRFDGYCPYCSKNSTFDKYDANWGFTNTTEQSILEISRRGEMNFRCAREDDHFLRFYYRVSNAVVQKVGQLPSFADIAIDESKAYSQVLDKEDVSEFHKALGLAAHGVGIGSYVYLRRIFERLIWKRFDEFKDAEGWDDTEFRQRRMKERIELLSGHLPEFLVKNAKLYSILSLGVHELSETDCLSFFPVLRQSTIWILEQDRKKQEDLAQLKQLQEAIAKFAPSGDATSPQSGK